MRNTCELAHYTCFVGFDILCTGSSDSPLAAEMHSFSDGPAGASSGRLWFYIMGKEEADTFSASLTMSQSAIDVNMTCVVHGESWF